MCSLRSGHTGISYTKPIGKQRDPFQNSTPVAPTKTILPMTAQMDTVKQKDLTGKELHFQKSPHKDRRSIVKKCVQHLVKRVP